MSTKGISFFLNNLPKLTTRKIKCDCGANLIFSQSIKKSKFFAVMRKVFTALHSLFTLLHSLFQITVMMNNNEKNDSRFDIITVSENLNVCFSRIRVITGFALDDLNGMGITADPGLLDIFQPFYVQVDLPHSVKQGETLAVEMVIIKLIFLR